MSVIAPTGYCAGCDRPISPMNDWKTGPNGETLHRACEAPCADRAHFEVWYRADGRYLGALCAEFATREAAQRAADREPIGMNAYVERVECGPVACAHDLSAGFAR